MSRAAYMRLWRANHPGSGSEGSRAYHARNREQILEQKRRYYQDVVKAKARTDEGRQKERDKKSRRRSAAKSGTVTFEQWTALCASHDGRCAYCGRDDRRLEQDHVVPLSKGGAHCITNIVPACKPCNSKKGAR